MKDRGVAEFFEARYFAVVGVGREEKNVGQIIFKNLLKSGKKVFGVNPKATKILGQRIYKDLSEVPYKIDCAIIAVPAKSVPLILRLVGKMNIKCVSIISAGFSEAGNKELEEQIKRIAEEEKIKVIGPNTFGYIKTKEKTNTTFYSGDLKQGKIAFISQSGAIGSSVLDALLSLSSFVSVGNSMQLDFSDFIEYFDKDKDTEVITIYMESIKDGRGRRFIETCQKCKKPIIVIKSGTSKAGQKAAESHTAALANDYNIYKGILKQAGVIEADAINEMFNIAKILERYEIPKTKRPLIVTNAGGFGVLTTDYCEANKLNIVEVPEKVKQKLSEFLPKTWSHNNPVDIIGDADAERYEKTLKLLDKENFFDFFIVILTPQMMSEPAKTAEILDGLKKPVFACFIGGEQLKEAKSYFREKKILHFSEPKKLCKALGKI